MRRGRVARCAERKAGGALNASDEPYNLVGRLHRIDDSPHHVAIHQHEGGAEKIVHIVPALRRPVSTRSGSTPIR